MSISVSEATGLDVEALHTSTPSMVIRSKSAAVSQDTDISVIVISLEPSFCKKSPITSVSNETKATFCVETPRLPASPFV